MIRCSFKYILGTLQNTRIILIDERHPSVEVDGCETGRGYLEQPGYSFLRTLLIVLGEVHFGQEDSGRNTSQGVYVDNIGLNGLRILKNSNQRQFFLTADVSAVPGKRSFFLRANVDGNVTSHPITVEVLP